MIAIACLCGARSEVESVDRDRIDLCWNCGDPMYPIDSGPRQIGEILDPILADIDQHMEKAA